jgi:hypothetical protein
MDLDSGVQILFGKLVESTFNPNVTGANATPFRSCPSFLSNKTEYTFPLSK